MKLCPYVTRKIYKEEPCPPMYKHLVVESHTGDLEDLHLTYSPTNYTFTEHHTECKGELCMVYKNGECHYNK